MRARVGRIAVIGSVAALQGNPGNAAYAASKGALLSYCRTLAVETEPGAWTEFTITLPREGAFRRPSPAGGPA